MGKALLQISCSPFSQFIGQAELPHCFNQPTFTIYNGKTNPVKHVSHFNQRMAIHSKNKALMCKVFPSSLSQVAKRWFDILKEGSIHSFDGYFEDITVRTFKEGLPTHSNLWKSLTMKPTWGMHQLMDWIEEHKRVEDNQSSSKGKAKVFTSDRRDNSTSWFASSQLRREFHSQTSHNVVSPQAVNSMFKELIYQVLEKIKHEPYFK